MSDSRTAVLSLIGCGALLGLSTNLAKVASNLGVAPLPFLTWSIAGASCLLFLFARLRMQKVPRHRSAIHYFVIAAFFSVAGSNLVFFSAVPEVGVSFVALMISLPPLLTYVAALTLRMEKVSGWRTAGVLSALLGTGLLVQANWTSAGANQVWILITLLGPLLLAAGNIYRTIGWPKNASAEALAPGMLLASALMLAAAGLLVPGWSLSLPISLNVVALVVVQAFVFFGQFFLLFVLQKSGGPVFLSLVGAVSAVFGVPFAMVFLDEPLLPALLPSAAFIALGIACMLYGQRRRAA